MTGLYTTEIECLASRLLSKDNPKEITRLGSNSSRWLGVYARDELPNLEHSERPFALVFNTHPKDKPGQHWLAIYAPSNSPIKIFLIQLAWLPHFTVSQIHSFTLAVVFSHLLLIYVVITLSISYFLDHIIIFHLLKLSQF